MCVPLWQAVCKSLSGTKHVSVFSMHWCSFLSPLSRVSQGHALHSSQQGSESKVRFWDIWVLSNLYTNHKYIITAQDATLLLMLTPPYELWLPYNTLSKGNNIHLFPFPCTSHIYSSSSDHFQINCVICARLEMSVCHRSCSIACGVLLRLCLKALDLALKGGILSGSFCSATALPARSWLSTSTSRLWRWVTYPDSKTTS